MTRSRTGCARSANSSAPKAPVAGEAARTRVASPGRAAPGNGLIYDCAWVAANFLASRFCSSQSRHLARDEREHAIRLVDSYADMKPPTSKTWTPDGPRSCRSSPVRQRKQCLSMMKTESPLTDSNRRPPPCHEREEGGRSMRVFAYRCGFAFLAGRLSSPRFAWPCDPGATPPPWVAGQAVASDSPILDRSHAPISATAAVISGTCPAPR